MQHRQTAGVSTPGNPVGHAPQGQKIGRRYAPPGREYHRVFSSENRRVWRGILAIVLLLGGLQVFSIALVVGVSVIESQRGYDTPAFGGTDYTPLYHAVSFGSVALLIPWSMLIQRWLYGVRGASLHSVTGRFRFDLLGQSLIILGPIILAVLIVNDYLAPTQKFEMAHTTVLWLFATTLLLVPLQAAGEEYGFRGLIFRVASSWGRGPRSALLLGVIVSSAAFAMTHLSTDPWLNLWYLVFGATAAIIVWRTGGIAVAVVLHALFNTLSFALDIAVRTDFVTASNREAGAAGAYLLIAMLIWTVIAGIVWIHTRVPGPPLTPMSEGAALES